MRQVGGFLAKLAGLIVLAFCLQLLRLQVVDAGRLTAMAEEHSTNNVTLSARRGTIYDRHGNILAASEDCYTLYCNPTEISNEATVAQILARNLGGKASDYHEALSADTTFSYVAKRVETTKADAVVAEITNAGLKGIYELPDVCRVYPYGDVAGQVLGLVGEDGHGLTGLELYYDDVLSGTDGSRVMEVGLGGIPVAGGAYHETPATDGTDIVISLDVEIQEACEKALEEGLDEYDASGAMSCIMDPKTGEILAIASTPLLPAGDGSEAAPEAFNLSLLTQSFEPGSVSKVLTTAIGLESGAFTADTTWNVPWRMAAGDYFVTDDDDRGYDMDMDSAEILRRSSNVGTMVMGREIGGETLLRGLRSFGIGEPTGIDFPGETEGIVHDMADWDAATQDVMSFGQGYSVPPIQIIRAVAALCNHGILVTPHFLIYKGTEEVRWPEPRRVCTPETASAVARMMQGVVDDGTASKAAIEGFAVAGKTGTAQKADLENGGYLANELFSSFAGFTGVPYAELMGYVGVDGGLLHGGDSASPLFSRILSEALRDLSITPNAGDGTTAAELWQDEDVYDESENESEDEVDGEAQAEAEGEEDGTGSTEAEDARSTRSVTDADNGDSGDESNEGDDASIGDDRGGESSEGVAAGAGTKRGARVAQRAQGTTVSAGSDRED